MRANTPFADNFIPVIPVDELEHTPEKPFCWDSSCPCHEDPLLISEVNDAVQNGLMTPSEATGFVAGRGI